MNDTSSRSHAILIVKLEKSYIISPDKIKELAKESNETIMNERVMTKSTLFLVDLAGSERVQKTKAEAMRLEEAKKINFSLLVLGNCIQALTDPKCSHVSYRDSKLTRLLQESLGGNAKTSLIVTISPALYNVDETNSTLMFGARAMKVKNRPTINKTVDYQALSIKLQEDLDKLNDEYLKLKVEHDNMSEDFNKYKSAENFMEISKMADEQQKLPSGNNLNNDDQNYNKLLAEYENALKTLDEREEILLKMDNIFVKYEEECTQLKDDLKKFKDNNNELKTIIKEIEQEKMGIQDTVMDLESKNEGLRKINEELSKNTSEANLMNIEMCKLKELISILENEKENLVSENKELTDKINHSTMVKDEISTSMDVFKTDYHKVKEDNKKYKDMINQLEQDKEDVHSQYQIIKFKNEELQRIKSEMDKTLEDLKSENFNLSTLDSSLIKSNDNPMNKVRNIIKMSSPNLKGLIRKDTNLDNNLSSLNDFKNEFLRLKEDNENLKAKIYSLETQVVNKASNNQAEQNEKDSLIQCQENLIKKLKHEIKVLKDTIKENEEKIQTFDKTITELNIKNDDIEIEKLRYKSKFEKLNSDFEMLKKNRETKKDEITETDSDLFDKLIIDIALDQKLINSKKDSINIPILEKIIKNLSNNKNLNCKEIDKIDNIKPKGDINEKYIRDISTQTDNTSLSNRILEIAIQLNIINNKEICLTSILTEKLIIKIHENYNTVQQSLTDKTETCNKLMLLQKNNRKTIDDLEAYKRKVAELLGQVKDSEKLKEELTNLKITRSKEETLVEANFQEQLKNYEGELETTRKEVELLNKNQAKIKKRDTNTGIYLVKEYLNKTKDFLDDFYNLLGKKGD
jgi:hypothetical protein